MNKFLLAGIVLLSLMGATCVGVMSTSNDLRYKVTVEVETPEGIKTSSAVREASNYYERSILPGQGGRFFNITKGEAVVVDLGQRGILFSLLGGQDEARNVFSEFTGKNKKSGAVTLTPNQYAKFVRFRDLRDPKTVGQIAYSDAFKKSIAKIDPKRPVDTFEEAFGEDVHLKSVTIETTEGPVNFSIEKYLPWLSTVGMGNLGGSKFSGRELYERMSVWDFRKDIK